MGGVAEVAVAGARGEAGESFAGFFAEQYDDLAGYCESLAGASRADELAQEALTRVYARWGLLREPRAYAFRVATNLARDDWRDRRREAESWAARADREPGGGGPDPEVWAVVERLPERLRTVVLLHYLADLPLAEVAAAVRRPVGTVKRRLHEARAMLARAFEEDR